MRTASDVEQRAITQLVRRMYSGRGLSVQAMASTNPTGARTTLTACAGKCVMGTLTVALDTHEGLLADELYKTEIDVFRAKGRRASEVSKLAVDPKYGSKELLASLFQMVHLYLHVINGAHDAFIEVHPRHAGFYKRMLGFEQIGPQRMCERVNAPAVLLRLDFEYVRAQIIAHSGSSSGRERSLYPYLLECGAGDWVSRTLNCKAAA